MITIHTLALLCEQHNKTYRVKNNKYTSKMDDFSKFSFPYLVLFVHLVLEVAEGAADLCHTLSLSVTTQRPRFLLRYTAVHTSFFLQIARPVPVHIVYYEMKTL